MPTALRGLRYLVPGLTMLAWILCVTSPASAITIDLQSPGQREFVRDQAQMLDAATVAKIKEISGRLLIQTETPILVVTIDSMASCGAPGLRIETFATLLFEQWGIGVADINGQSWNTGILLLVSKGDRMARIELAHGWGRREDALCQKIMDEQIIYHFKQQKFSEGVLAGVRALDCMVRDLSLPTRPWPTWLYVFIIGAIAMAIFTVVSLCRKGSRGWAWATWAAIFAAMGDALRETLRNRRRRGSGYSGGSFGGSSFGGSFGGGSSGGSSSGGGGATGSW